MTWLDATRLVAVREIREAFRRRSLWIVLAILFVGSSVAMILPDALDSGTTHYSVATNTSTASTLPPSFTDDIRRAVSHLDARVTFRTVPTRARARQLVDDGDADVAIVGGASPVVIVRSGENDALVAVIRQALTTSALVNRLEQAGLDQADVDQILGASTATVHEIASDSSDRRASAAILSLLLYLVLLLLMVQVANGVAIEKSNHISEVLLAVVKPTALFFGKVVGVGFVGLVGIAAGGIPVVAKVLAGGDLPAGLGPALAGGLPWMVLGIVLYLTTAGALGALVERQEETGSVLTPLSLLLIATYVLAQSSAEGTFGAVLAIFPFTSPIFMPTRLALGGVSAAEIVASLVIEVVTVVFVVRLGAAIYRRGIVHTGRRLRLGEVLRTT